MKIAWFKTVITPALGSGVAGYDYCSRAARVRDDLYMTGLCLDNGVSKALIISFDLLALDGWFVRKIRKECAAILGTKEEMILLTCTHTHNGPEAATPLAPNHDQVNSAFVEQLGEKIIDSVKKLGDFKECDVTFYSSKCDQNRNRRYITCDNQATFTPWRRELIPIANEYADKEFGQLCFFDKETRFPIYVIGNYAAHPLAGHAPGLGYTVISADYPGVFRNYVKSETGAECMFINGAAGDMVPKEDELGSAAVREMGVALGKVAIGGIIDSSRNPHRFTLEEPKLDGEIRSFTVPIRRKFMDRVPPEYKGKDTVTLEVQMLAIGDICFVGMPGEVCAELGQEIKWHSPFRKAFIAYYSTSDFSYMCPANFLVSGGYEGSTQQFGAMGGFEILRNAVEGMFAMRQRMNPLELGEESYPDNLNQPLVNLPQN